MQNTSHLRLDNSRITNANDVYSESSQTTPCKFAFAAVEDNVVYPLFKPVLCRDYLNDIVAINRYYPDMPIETAVYGFYPAKHDININTLCLVVNHESMLLAINLFMEKINDMHINEFFTVTPIDKSNTLFESTGSFWTTSPLHISIITSWIRFCFRDTIDLSPMHSNQEYETKDYNEYMMRSWGLRVMKKLNTLPIDFSQSPLKTKIAKCNYTTDSLDHSYFILTMLHAYSGYYSACTRGYNDWQEELLRAV